MGTRAAVDERPQVRSSSTMVNKHRRLPGILRCGIEEKGQRDLQAMTLSLVQPPPAFY